MAGSSVLQPNSPQSMVTAALSSANKTRALARRIYYSFRFGKPEVELADVARFFPTLEVAHDAFAVLDSDGNGGANRDEIEMSLMYISPVLLFWFLRTLTRSAAISGRSTANASRSRRPCATSTAPFAGLTRSSSPSFS